MFQKYTESHKMHCQKKLKVMFKAPLISLPLKKRIENHTVGDDPQFEDFPKKIYE
jgi:hypothetical protein